MRCGRQLGSVDDGGVFVLSGATGHEAQLLRGGAGGDGRGVPVVPIRVYTAQCGQPQHQSGFYCIIIIVVVVSATELRG